MEASMNVIEAVEASIEEMEGVKASTEVTSTGASTKASTKAFIAKNLNENLHGKLSWEYWKRRGSYGNFHGCDVYGNFHGNFRGSFHGCLGRYERFHESNFHGSFHELPKNLLLQVTSTKASIEAITEEIEAFAKGMEAFM